MDDQQFRQFTKDAKDRAHRFAGESYVAADVRKTLLDLLTVVASFERKESESDGQTADARILKRKLDVSKQEVKAVEKRLDTVKQKMTDLLDVVIAIGTETSKMPEDVRVRVKEALQKTAKAINEAVKL